ncbi:MAG: glycosyltransferase [Pseudomonadota bacterium]|nr:glycosyltransferase [Pseudomonadota bacterium]
MELSICIPTYNRPELLQRALASVAQTPPAQASHVEIIVSDNSTDDRSAAVTARFAQGWPGPVIYHQNKPSISRVDNQNQSIALARGRWVQILHDDDYLLSGGIDRLLVGLDRARSTDRVLLFGVNVVDKLGRRLRSQSFFRDRFLAPHLALQRLLSHSSFVRMPAIVVRREAYTEIGPFESGWGGIDDIAMWIRLFGAYGVRLFPLTTSAYMVHPAADSYAVSTPEAITTLTHIFEYFVPRGVLSERALRRCRTHFFHQFVLAGTFRRLRARDRAGAQKVMELFQMPEVRSLGLSFRWAPVRLAFATACIGVRATRS